MFALRPLLVSLTTALVAAAFACNAPAAGDPPEGGEAITAKSATKGAATDGGASSPSKNANANADAGPAVPAKGAPADDTGKAAPTDPCVAGCEATLRPKCDGDDSFCTGTCSSLTDDQIACVSAALDCSKASWLACVPPAGDDDDAPLPPSGGKPSGGKK